MTSMDIDSPSTPNMAITPVMPADNSEAPISEEQPNRRRRKKSIVWEHFTIETVGAGCMRACCKQCKKSFAYITGPKLAGTSHLKRHIALGICPVSRQKNEASPLTPGAKSDPPKRRYRSSPGYGNIPFDQDRCNQEIAKMIIQHEYPLHIVEHPAFIDFVRTLQPQYNMPSFNTIQGECVSIYLREKQSLLNLISGIPGRVNLALDLGTSNLDTGYAFLTGHFIDDDWNLHRRILNVVMLPFPDSDYALNQAVVSCLSDWHLESRLCSLTLDQSFSNETVMGNLRSLLSVKNQRLFNCQLLKGNCYARVLSRLAQDALGSMGEVIGKVRESVKYVKTSETHDEKFAELRQRLQVPSTKELIIDDQTKWNTTYQMLVAACELKEVFDCLDTSDPVYKINPSINDWKQVEILCRYLKLLYDAAGILTSPIYPPANAFYHEVSKIQLELTRLAMSQDPFVSSLTKPLKEKFDQYWKDSFLVLVIAVVMDPRFKMKLVEFSFSKIFGEDAGMWIKIVDDGIHELFLDYLPPNLSVTTFMQPEDMVIPQTEMLQDVGPQDQEAHFQDLQLVHSVDVPTQEVHSQGATVQDIKLEKETPQGHLNEPSQDVTPQVLHHQEVAQEEMHTQEIPAQEMQIQELALQEMDSQQLQIQENVTHEASVQELSTQETSEHEMHIDYQLPLQDTDAQEVSPQAMNSQEMPAPEPHVQGLAAQEAHVQELPAQEVHLQEVPDEGMHAQEVPTQDMLPQEVGVQLVHHSEVVAQDMNPSEAHSHEMHTEAETPEMHPPETQSQEMHTPEAQTQEMDSPEAQTQEMHSPEAQTQEMNPPEVKAQEMCSQEAQLHETQPQEAASQEMQHHEVLSHETHPEEVLTQEMHPQEVQTQDLLHQEGQSQETHHHEAQSQEMHYHEGQTQDMDHHEVQDPEIRHHEVQAQEMHHHEVQAQEMHKMHHHEVQAQEMHHHEVQAQEMHHHEVQRQDMDHHEVQAPEIHHHEVQAPVMHHQEVQIQEMHHCEVQAPEMHHQEVETQEMHHPEFSQEMQPYEVNHQDLPLLSTIGDGYSDFEVYISATSNQHLKSELDQYLEESLLPRVHDFDVLGWWKLNKLKYPTLSKMAADILSIPISTVAPDSVFDTGSKKIDSYQSSLRPVILEALICAKDWLQYGSSASSLDVSNALVKMEH
ncbi:zinc finger BED domain-containing protein DAYSLEEPER [Jatropha curcas]|uniref:zinc finger BED domain-containing protein DAYSLEEPER n=1 Tax=Jatropha curcas TaxID=180498 RepID=UPI0018939B85|nr:zinc finger BED domain-containing protein DAYSLEEPER [Jatropha curcas]XP_020535223.2 zinc finger BED domain-containing protein DAYSLEEPER [Jatropha curcas]